MDKTVAGLVGAMSALAAASSAQASSAVPMNFATPLHAASYADLLKPIPNALALMKADAALLPNAVEGEATVHDVQLQIILPGRHHHHHHHRYWRRRHHHHHHHRYYR